MAGGRRCPRARGETVPVVLAQDRGGGAGQGRGDAFLELGELLDPGHRPQGQLMSTAIRSPGNPSSADDASCRVSQPIAASALNTCPDSRCPSQPSAVICPEAIAGSTAIPRRDSSDTANPGPASLSQAPGQPVADERGGHV